MPNERIDCFLDSNILIYAAAGRIDEPQKFSVSADLVTTRNFGLSGQSLAEFCSVTRKKEMLSDAELDAWLDRLSAFPNVPVDAPLVRAGLWIAQRYQIQYYDAALVAAAERLGAPTFYTEDLNHGQIYGTVRAVNPFLEH